MTVPADILRQLLPEIIRAADVRHATAQALEAELPTLRPRVHLLSIGKASLEMAGEACTRLGKQVARGLATAVPERIPGVSLPGTIRVLPADHPLPTPRNVEAARAVAEFVSSIPASDQLLVLISGGGSRHLAWPAEGLSLEDLRRVTTGLQRRAGATINQLNAVRKHCERLKGGNLARRCTAGHTLALVVSDVIGDPLDVISSGPFTPDPTTFADALAILQARGVESGNPAVVGHVRAGVAGTQPETPKPGDPAFRSVRHRIIASNTGVVDAIVRRLSEAITVEPPRVAVTGEAGRLGSQMAEALRRLRAEKGPGPRAIVWGGEWTVDVGAQSGVGGPSQEMALAAAIGIESLPGAAVLCYSTDGIDGPTDAAGAIVDSQSTALMRASAVDPRQSLQRHDSHAALDVAGALLRTGPTGTNVNHVAIGIVS